MRLFVSKDSVFGFSDFTAFLAVLILAVFFVGCGDNHMPVEKTLKEVQSKNDSSDSSSSENLQITYDDQILPIFQRVCSVCHNDKSSNGNWLNYQQAFFKKEVIYDRVVVKQNMPPLKDGLTAEERELIGEWILSGALKFQTPNLPSSAPEVSEKNSEDSLIKPVENKKSPAEEGALVFTEEEEEEEEEGVVAVDYQAEAVADLDLLKDYGFDFLIFKMGDAEALSHLYNVFVNSLSSNSDRFSIYKNYAPSEDSLNILLAMSRLAFTRSYVPQVLRSLILEILNSQSQQIVKPTNSWEVDFYVIGMSMLASVPTHGEYTYQDFVHKNIVSVTTPILMMMRMTNQEDVFRAAAKALDSVDRDSISSFEWEVNSIQQRIKYLDKDNHISKDSYDFQQEKLRLYSQELNRRGVNIKFVSTTSPQQRK